MNVELVEKEISKQSMDSYLFLVSTLVTKGKPYKLKVFSNCLVFVVNSTKQASMVCLHITTYVLQQEHGSQSLSYETIDSILEHMATRSGILLCLKSSETSARV